jgi:hypothetical protein
MQPCPEGITMKRLALLIAITLTGWTLSSGAAPGGVSFGIFYNSLSPHGAWIHASAGVYAWHPDGVGEGWRPYYNGRWVWTDDGWFWDSDEPWAWAVYHYGRWYEDDEYGWVWVPGYDWSPAWVEWRYGGDCMGWAPLGPYAVFSMSWGIHYTRHWVTPLSYWTFIDCRRFNRSSVHEYAYRPADNARWFGRTRGAGSVVPDGGRIITRGPERGYVEQRGNLRVERAEVVALGDRAAERYVRGRDGRDRIEVYRPRLDAGPVRGEPDRPSRVKETERPLNLDVRNADVRSRDIAREEGRNLGRAEEYRTRRLESGRFEARTGAEGERPGNGSRAPDAFERRSRSVERGGYAPDAAWGRRRDVDRAPDRRNEPIDRPPRYDRLERRSDPPERTARRPETRIEPGRSGGGAPAAPRGGSSSGRGGGGDTRRGGSRR